MPEDSDTVSSVSVSLLFDAGTLVLEGLTPESPSAWLPEACVWDPRVARYRAPAFRYREVLTHLTRASREHGFGLTDSARDYRVLALAHRAVREPFEHQSEAVRAWDAAGRRGVVVLPTGAGKSYVAEMAIAAVQRSTLVVAPTLDLVHQWHTGLRAAFGEPVGILGGGERDVREITVTTYDSASIHAERLGSRFGLVVFDECHHLPSPMYATAATRSIAPYRLGLSATPDRGDDRDQYLREYVGPVVYSRGIRELTGEYLADYDVQRVTVTLDADEATRYTEQRAVYRAFLRSRGIDMRARDGWGQFLTHSSRSAEGRRAFLAYREQRQIAIASRAKLDLLGALLHEHADDHVLVFANDNETVYRIANGFLLPALTHQTSMRERVEILERFGNGTYPAIVTSRVLNEGVNLPDARVAIVLSGTGSVREHVQRLGRILRRREGKRALLYEVVSAETMEEHVSARRREHDAYRVDEC